MLQGGASNTGSWPSAVNSICKSCNLWSSNCHKPRLRVVTGTPRQIWLTVVSERHEEHLPHLKLQGVAEEAVLGTRDRQFGVQELRQRRAARGHSIGVGRVELEVLVDVEEAHPVVERAEVHDEVVQARVLDLVEEQESCQRIISVTKAQEDSSSSSSSGLD